MPESHAPPPLSASRPLDRRTALKTLAAVSATAGSALLPVLPGSAQHAQHAAASSPASAYTPRQITGVARDLLTAICDRIIPRTDTPGAADAGVADQIDWYATRRNGLANTIREALQRVEAIAGQPFTSLAAADQDAVLTKMSLDLSTDDGMAFTLLKNLTIDAYYSSKPGLQGELGWNANTYLADFPGCSHDHSAEAGE